VVGAEHAQEVDQRPLLSGELFERMERVSAQVADLTARIPDDACGEGRAWSATEMLAHIAGLSFFFGDLARQGRACSLRA
jgi:hypothetical protein